MAGLSILLCLTPDNFTCQRGTPRSGWVNLGSTVSYTDEIQVRLFSGICTGLHGSQRYTSVAAFRLAVLYDHFAVCMSQWFYRLLAVPHLVSMFTSSSLVVGCLHAELGVSGLWLKGPWAPPSSWRISELGGLYRGLTAGRGGSWLGCQVLPAMGSLHLGAGCQ